MRANEYSQNYKKVPGLISGAFFVVHIVFREYFEKKRNVTLYQKEYKIYENNNEKEDDICYNCSKITYGRRKSMKRRGRQFLAILLAVLMILPMDSFFVLAMESEPMTEWQDDMSDGDVFSDTSEEENETVQESADVSSDETEETYIPETEVSEPQQEESSAEVTPEAENSEIEELETEEEKSEPEEEIIEEPGNSDTENESQELTLDSEETEEKTEALESENEIAVFSDDTQWTGKGTEDEPYEISTEADLRKMSQLTQSASLGGYFILKNDIALTETWIPVGKDGNNCFKGVFDGNNFTVSNVQTDSVKGYAGFFGYNSGTVRNLSIQGNLNVNGIAGLLIGYNKGTVENCRTEGSVTSSSDGGGIIGENAGTVKNSTASVTVTGNGNAGGFMGENYGTVSGCGALGNVSGQNGENGGFVGYNTAKIENCYARGTVSGSGNTGGFLGRSERVSVKYCYASGTVNDNTGKGFGGYFYQCGPKFCYYNSANTGNREGIPVTLQKLKDQNTYYGWDFEHVWTMDENSYPAIDFRGEAGAVEIEGDGSEVDPYLIKTENQLQALCAGELPLKGRNYYVLANDIVLTGENWTPVGGNNMDAFGGVFDGQGHTISGLKLSGRNERYTGLFGENNGTICNLTVAGNIEAVSEAGILAGCNNGRIENCSVSGTVSSTGSHGGMVGLNSNKGVIENSTASAEISGTGEAGGFVGSNQGTIRYSGAAGKVSGSTEYAGGFTGYHSGTIENCYAWGKVSGSNTSGGFAGRAYNGSIKFCYALGMVNDNAGAGFVNDRYYSSIRFCYYNASNTGNRQGIPMTVQKLKKQETYTSWDFEHIWALGEKGYPVISLREEAGEIEIEGDGSEEDPYQIVTEKQLEALAVGTLPLKGKNYYVLGNDITLSSENWTPIGGNDTDVFCGIFDGQGHTISGLKISGRGEVYTGLFGANTGTIRNLNVSGKVEAESFAGILLGQNKGKIENCTVSGAVESSGTHGGLIGINEENAVIEDCISDVTVTGNGEAGGFAGSNNGTIRYSGARGKVSGSREDTGGFVGYNNRNIENSYARGKVSGTGNTGGFCGRNYYGKITYCYSSGNVNDNTGGGFVGSRYSDVIRFCYFNSANTGNRDGIPATTQKLKKQETYSGWDFSHIWTMSENSYPVIQRQGELEEIEIAGDGSEENPYVITTEAQLQALTENRLPVNGNYYYILGNDITLSSENWTPVGGNGTDSFRGVFDGQGYTIRGLKISGRGNLDAGLFGSNEGTIRNLKVEGSVENTSNAGILAGRNKGRIENCSVSGNVSSTETHGGLVGINEQNATIEKCQADVTVEGSGIAGGFVGSNNGTIQYCSATGKVSGSREDAGGFIGYNQGVVRNSYSWGRVSGTGNTGGFVGREYYGSMYFCYSVGMTNDNKGAGLVGYRYSDKVRFCYYNAANTGNREGIPLLTAKLKEKSSYTGWDFEHIWNIGEKGYPVIDLRGEEEEIEISGDGSEENPYVIKTEAQLQALTEGKLPLAGKNYYVLGNDIELSSGNWTPVGGNGADAFEGFFDGKGYTIQGLKISGRSEENTGFFGINKGEIRNLNISGTVEASSNAGILVGSNRGILENCKTSGSVSSQGNHGGLVGMNENTGVVRHCSSQANISGKGTGGGLAGYNNGQITESFATGTVTEGSEVGGLAGDNYYGTIENSFARGNVTGNTAGGLVGRYYYGKIINCYSTGKANEGTGGGLIGSSYGTVTNSYYCSTTSFCKDTDKGTPLSREKMRTEGNYEGWDFSETWGIYSTINNGYPFLLWEIENKTEVTNTSFWYEVGESKKGFAKMNQDMQIYLTAENMKTVKYHITYVQSQETRTMDVVAEYNEKEQAFKGTFHIDEDMQEISALSATVTNNAGEENVINFDSSYNYQIPLKIEGLLNVKIPAEFVKDGKMSLQLKNSYGSSVVKMSMDGKTEFTIPALETGIYKAELYAGNMKYAERSGIKIVQGQTTLEDFSDLSAVADVAVEFYAEGRKVSSDDFTLNFYDKTEGKDRLLEKGTELKYLAAGDKIGYSLELTGNGKRKYRVDDTIYEKTLNEGLNVIQFQLKPFHNTTCEISAVNQVSGNPLPGVYVSVSQKLNGVYSRQTSGITNASGKCTLEVADEKAEVVVSKTGYETQRLTLSEQELGKGLNLEVEPLSGIVEFDLSYEKNVLASSSRSAEKDVLKPLEVTLIRDKTKTKSKLSMKDWPRVYVDGSGWNPGETFTAEIKTDQCGTQTITTSVNTFGNLYFSGVFKGRGSLMVSVEWEKGVTSGTNNLALYDKKGDRVTLVTSGSTMVTMDNLEKGTYTLAAADKDAGLGNYQTLGELQKEDSMNEKYVSSEVSIMDGIIQETDVTIPAPEVSRQLLVREESGILVNNSYARIGDYIHVRAKYVFNDEMGISGKTVTLEVPSGTKFVEKSFTVDGKQESVGVSGNKLTWNTDKKELLVRYSVKVLTTVTVSELEFSGSVEYAYDTDRRTELLGKAAVQLNELTINVPAQTNYTNLIANGIGPKNSSIEIYDEGILIGQTTSNKYGVYRVAVELNSGSKNTLHHLKAATKEGKESETVEVQYGTSTASVLKLEIGYNGGNVLVINDPTQEIASSTISYNPSYPFSFKAYFDDNRTVNDVQMLISLKNGNTLEVPLYYDEVMDVWMASQKLNSGEIPESFSIEFQPIAFNYGEVTALPYEISSIQNGKFYELIGGISGYESEVTMDDSSHTKLMALNEIQKDAAFTPSDTYTCIDVDGSKVYFDLKADMQSVVRNGTEYLTTQYYMLLDDGTYVLCRRGIGVKGSVSSEALSLYAKVDTGEIKQGIKDIKNAKEAMDYFKLLEETSNYKYEKSEANKAMDDIIAEAEKSTNPRIRNKAMEWKAKKELVDLAERLDTAYDMTDKVISNDSADNGNYDKIWKQVAKKMQQTNQSMRDLNNKTAQEWMNDVYADIFNDEEFMDYLMADKTDKEKKALRDRIKKLRKKYKITNAKVIVDPSGYVYETFPENRLEGVTATLYYENDEGNMQVWDAEEYQQINPQKTDKEGAYGWDVPEGLWQVSYSKEGYETVKSEKLEVPPPQLDVNIEMVSKNGAAIAGQAVNYNRITIVFDKYIQKASLGSAVFDLTLGASHYEVIPEIKTSDIKNYKGVEVTKKADLVLKTGKLVDGTYKLHIGEGIQTYSGVISKAMDTSFVSASSEDEQIRTIKIPEKVTVMRGDEELSDGAQIQRNDRILIQAKPDEGETLETLTVNGVSVKDGEYYTVADVDLIIEAVFKKPEITYTMSFDSVGGSRVSAITGISGNTLVSRPADPTREYCTFEGWYTDPEYHTAWDFSGDRVTENMVLYAKWKNKNCSITLNNKESDLYIGETIKLEADVAIEGTKTDALKKIWSSSDKTVASVAEDGTVTAKNTGTAVITVTVENMPGAQAKCQLTVRKRNQILEGTDLYSKTSGDRGFYLDITLKEGDGDLTYTSSDNSVASVSRLGRVLVKHPGTAEIVVSASETKEYDAAEKTIVIKVTKGVQTLQGTMSYTVTAGEKAIRLDTYLEEGDGNLSYKSSDTQLISVTENGFVYGKKKGTATVTVTASETDNFKSAVLNIKITVGAPKECKHSYGAWKTVKDATVFAEGKREAVCVICGNKKTEKISKLPKKLKLSVTSLTLKVKKTAVIKVTQIQKGDSVLSWSASNKNVTVSKLGKVTANKAGTAVITVKLKSGISAKVNVKVQDIVATKISVSPSKLTLARGKTKKLTVKVLPANCTQKTTYKSSNSKIVTVTSSGIVKGVKKGTAKITIQTGNKKTYCTVTVK